MFLNSYGCTFYRLSEIGSDNPRLDNFFALDTPPPPEPGSIRGSCGIPVVFGHYWINPGGEAAHRRRPGHRQPGEPARSVPPARRPTPSIHTGSPAIRSPTVSSSAPSWAAKRASIILRFDEQTGRLSFDPAFRGEGQAGYMSLKNQSWPHGATGPAWGHAALFLPQSR